jgi:hypothetical protein
MPRKSGGKPPHSKKVDISDDYDLFNSKVDSFPQFFANH